MYKNETASIGLEKAKQGATVVELAKDGGLRIFKRSRRHYIVNQ
jgi:hypothetical protein